MGIYYTAKCSMMQQEKSTLQNGAEAFWKSSKDSVRAHVGFTTLASSVAREGRGLLPGK